MIYIATILVILAGLFYRHSVSEESKEERNLALAFLIAGIGAGFVYLMARQALNLV